ncbi:hypothetical protein KEJ49_04650 [Candidatus Bathyarchaeota archaeon]|nr:hypothetical protein [Candidatus Bathyarchaeota archaeon]
MVNAFLMLGFQSLVADYAPRGHWDGMTSAIGGGRFFVDIKGARVVVDTLLFITASSAS